MVMAGSCEGRIAEARDARQIEEVFGETGGEW